MEHPPSIRFNDTSTLFKTLSNRLGEDELFVFTRVSPAQFADINDKRDNFYRTKIGYQPSKDGGLLFITVPGGAHEGFLGEFFSLFDAALRNVGIKHLWDHRMATTFKSPNGIVKEGDFTGNPRLSSGPGREWPTIVLEIGRSQTIQSLRMDMQLWFHESQHAVKIVLLAKLNRGDHSILIEKYTEELAPIPRPGPTTRSTPRVLTPTLRQTLWIREIAASPPDYKVSGAPLILEFHLLFSRPPDTASGEQDLTIGEEDLAILASATWRNDV